MCGIHIDRTITGCHAGIGRHHITFDVGSELQAAVLGNRSRFSELPSRSHGMRHSRWAVRDHYRR